MSDENGIQRNGDSPLGGEDQSLAGLTPVDTRPARPVRKDERVIAERGLYVEIWLPERRSRRKPLYLLHGELGGSWLWQRFLNYFAQRGWEGHALNLRGHYWSETADFGEIDFDSYLADAVAGMAHLARPPIIVGHGLGGLLALKLWERSTPAGVVLISPALPAPLLPPPAAHVVRLMPRLYRRELLGWDGPPAAIRRQHPDLSEADVLRVQHMMGVESGTARRQMLEGIAVDRAALVAVPRLVIGGGLDRQFPAADSERLADWLGATYQPFADHSHYGLVIGEKSAEPVAEAVRVFLEGNRL
jgi:alpha-beta hydrolase superfamily lysophospholipase